MPTPVRPAPAPRAARALALGAALGALAAGAAPARAQTAPAAPVPLPVIAAGDSATAAAVERLLQVSNAERAYNQAVALSVAAQARSNPALAAQAGVLRAFVDRYAGYAAVRADMVRVYRETFTAGEVEELTRFYASDLGRRLGAKLPLAMARANELLALRVQAHLPELIDMLRAGERPGAPRPEGAGR